MRITTSKKDSGAVLKMEGELDYNSYKEFEEIIGSLIEEKAKPIVIDMSEIVHIDSMGLGSITKAWKKTHQAELDFVLASIPPNVAKMVKLVNLDNRIPVVEEVGLAFQ